MFNIYIFNAHFSISHRMCIYKNHNSDEKYWNKMQHLEPCPRFAYQLVYDQKNKVF